MKDRQLNGQKKKRGRRGHHRMIVGFITTYVISDYIHYCCESRWDVCCSLYNIVIKFVSELQWFSSGILASFTNKTDHHTTEILLNVALNTIILTQKKRTKGKTMIHKGLRLGNANPTKQEIGWGAPEGKKILLLH